MRIVTITRDLRPWQARQDAVLPDALAERLVKEGAAENPRPYPPADVAPVVQVNAPPAATSRKRYSTRERG